MPSQRMEQPGAEDAVLLARVADAVRCAEHHSRADFVGFLDERQAAVAAAATRNCPGALLWGGAEGCERVLLGVFPDWQQPEPEEFPLTAVTFRFRREAELTHRDVLGALMGLGVKRDTVGDIRVEKGRAVAFVRKEILPYFLTQLTKIGREGIAVSEGAELPLPGAAERLPISGTVASARLDCVVSALTNVSRSGAAEQIAAGAVLLNYEVCLSGSREVAEGDKISVRGEGKYLIERLGPLTKKQRLSFCAGKYH